MFLIENLFFTDRRSVFREKFDSSYCMLFLLIAQRDNKEHD